MNKLTQKEMFMVIILINLVLYYIGYLVVFAPMNKMLSNTKENYIEAKAENDKIKAEIAANNGYITDIATLKNERKDTYEHTFPDAEPELIHKFINEKLKAHTLSLDNLKITPVKDVSKKEDGTEVESIFKSNMVEFNYTGPYKNTKDLLLDIEGLDRTSAIVKFDLSSGEAGDSTSLTLNLFTVEKDVEDKIFNYTVPGSLGGSDLNIR